ncbi:hypothetical protein ACFSC4_05570 [Deinococcus malanensis]|uniref:hypothetical protein n=1 Tax=Deinococcus malanensis TaxID=1706855 RepID=UPI001E2BECF2|nr:hypothetical protein [Deinococcus malanensis]
MLSSVVHLTEGFWEDSPDLLAWVQAVAGRALTRSGLPASVLQDIHAFQARTGPLSP